MEAIPAVLEIPSKHHPYDPSKDSILRRAKVRDKYCNTQPHLHVSTAQLRDV